MVSPRAARQRRQRPTWRPRVGGCSRGVRRALRSRTTAREPRRQWSGVRVPTARAWRTARGQAGSRGIRGAASRRGDYPALRVQAFCPLPGGRYRASRGCGSRAPPSQSAAATNFWSSSVHGAGTANRRRRGGASVGVGARGRGNARGRCTGAMDAKPQRRAAPLTPPPEHSRRCGPGNRWIQGANQGSVVLACRLRRRWRPQMGHGTYGKDSLQAAAPPFAP